MPRARRRAELFEVEPRIRDVVQALLRFPLQTPSEASLLSSSASDPEARPSRAPSSGSRRACRRLSPLRTRASPSASRKGHTRRPRRPSACRLACPRACSGLMYAAVPRITPAAVARAVSVGECVDRGRGAGRVGFEDLREAEVEELHLPSPVTFTFAGFRSRWTIPFSCAASSASAICLAYTKANLRGRAPAVSRVRAPPLPPAPSRGGAGRPPPRRRRSPRCSGGAAPPELRLALEAGLPLPVLEESLRQDLQRHDAVEARVLRPVDLPHPARAERQRIS